MSPANSDSIAAASAALRASLSSMDVASLETAVRHHNQRYWQHDAPEVDDPTFDALVETLRARAPSSAVLLELGEQARGPTARGFGDVEHQRPMLSLDKCYDDDTLARWAATFKGPVMVTPKIDGVACSLRYGGDGRLKRAATRGDGRIGDDITANARGIRDIPRTIPTSSPDAVGPAPASDPRDGVEVRGEVYMRVSRFREHYQADKANPRNLAAGALKTRDPHESAAYGLSFFAYDLVGVDVRSEQEKRARLREMGFALPPGECVDDHAALADAFRRFVDICKAMDAETDGVVLKADRVDEQERLGVTAHHPRYALAYKFQGESAHTTVREIEWGIARTGVVTPVALVEPIFVSGVTVSRVSLHNAGYAQKLGIGRGARVEVVRRGGVIPHVERVLAPPAEAIALPTEWPVDGGVAPLTMDGDFLVLRDAERSRDVVISRVLHFTRVIDAVGFGEKRLGQLVDTGLVRAPADLYKLDVASLSALDRMGDTSAQALVDEMNARRRLTLPVFLASLGIEDLGPTVAEALADHLHDLPAVRAATPEQLQSIHGIGPTTAAAIVEGLRASARIIDELLAFVTLVARERANDDGHPLFGRSVVFTGTMAKLDRKSAQKRVQAVGGKTPSSVTKDLDFLVIGDDGSPLLGAGEKSTKHKEADKLIARGAAVRIISESAFLEMLGG